VRDHLISPRAIVRLADLNATDAELEIIEAQVALLGKTPRLGYLLPFSDPHELRRYDVGRFGLIYKFDDARVEIVTVDR
jgi:mRNA-degrading endonuclease RelE of RelBE toxin-antitoxin system